MTDYLHDTHFHLDLYDNIPKIITEIEKNRIYTVAVTNLPALFEKLSNQVNSRYIRVALGFHPELLLQYRNNINKMWENLNKTRYIGEVGLDFKQGSEDERNIQIAFFKELIQRCDSIGDKIISVHSRGSVNDVLSIIGDRFKGKIIMHWYSGTLNNLQKAIDYGYYFSINYSMLNSKNGKKIIEKIPDNQFLLESDGPFVKLNNKIFQPSDMNIIVRKLSEQKNIPLPELKNRLYRNFRQLLE